MRMAITKIWSLFVCFLILGASACPENSLPPSNNFELGNMPAVPVTNIENLRLVYNRTLKTPNNSIFYNLIPEKNGNFIAFYRIHYSEHRLGLSIFGKNLELLENRGEIGEGEDPRSFKHNGNWYITDNKLNKNKIFHATTDNFGKVHLTEQYGPDIDQNFQDGKNPTYISYQGKLYFIKWFSPLEIYAFDEKLQTVQLIHRGSGPVDNKFRGGTSGFPTGKNGEFVGFGHYTVLKEKITKHYPFIWKLNMNKFDLKIKTIENVQPLNIFDPITIIQINGKLLLITAESVSPWFIDQNYTTNIWDIDIGP